VTGPFRSQSPLTYPLLFVYGLLLRLSAFLDPSPPVTGPADGFLYDGLVAATAMPGGTLPLLFPFIAYLLVFVQALTLDGLMNRERLLPGAGRLPAMSYLLVTALLPDGWRLSAPLLANTLVLPALSLLGAAMNNRRAGRLMFLAGLLVGLATLVHFPAVLFLLLPYWAIVSMGPFTAAVWVLALTGFLLPFYYTLSLQYLLSAWDPASVWKAFRPGLPGMGASGIGPWAWSVLLLPLASGIWHVNRQVFRMLIRSRKCWYLFLFQLALAAVTPFLLPSAAGSGWVSLAPGLSALHANAYVQPRRRWVPELMHWACLLVILLANLAA
jgi:hypothetical protein